MGLFLIKQCIIIGFSPFFLFYIVYRLLSCVTRSSGQELPWLTFIDIKLKFLTWPEYLLLLSCSFPKRQVKYMASLSLHHCTIPANFSDKHGQNYWTSCGEFFQQLCLSGWLLSTPWFICPFFATFFGEKLPPVSAMVKIKLASGYIFLAGKMHLTL